MEQARRQRRPVQPTYHGRQRTVCPHALGGKDCGIAWREHDSGVVLAHSAVAIADGADCLSSLRALSDQEALFGPVASVGVEVRLLERGR